MDKRNYRYTLLLFVGGFFLLLIFASITKSKDRLFIVREKIKSKNKNNENELVNINMYHMLNLPDRDIAFENLKYIKRSLSLLIEYMREKYGDSEQILRTVERFENTQFSESSNEHNYHTFTKDKGDKIIFCLRENGKGKLHDLNTMMFVALHEFAHIYSTTYHHTPEFMANFKTILQDAVEIGIYIPQDYSVHPVSYCKMKITSNPLYIKQSYL